MESVPHTPENIQRLIDNVIDLDVVVEDRRRDLVESVTAFRLMHSLRQAAIDELNAVVKQFRGVTR
jgi:hypothetical protein